MTFSRRMWWGCQPYALAVFTPRNVPGTHFLYCWIGPRSMEGSEGDMSLKNPVTQLGIDPRTIRLVAQHLNHYTTPMWNWVCYRNICDQKYQIYSRCKVLTSCMPTELMDFMDFFIYMYSNLTHHYVSRIGSVPNTSQFVKFQYIQQKISKNTSNSLLIW